MAKQSNNTSKSTRTKSAASGAKAKAGQRTAANKPKATPAAAVSAAKTRRDRLAKRAAIQATVPGSAAIATKTPKAAKGGGAPSKNTRNRELNAMASQTRTKIGGSISIKAHVASAGRRNQSRRDAKN